MNDKTIDRVSAIVTAYLGRTAVPPADVPDLIRACGEAVMSLSSRPTRPPAVRPPAPVVSPSESVGADRVRCIACGAARLSLRRHLKTAHGLTPAAYRAAYGLASDFSIVAPAYSRRRSDIAVDMNLGQMRRRGRPETGDRHAIFRT